MRVAKAQHSGSQTEHKKVKRMAYIGITRSKSLRERGVVKHHAAKSKAHLENDCASAGGAHNERNQSGTKTGKGL